MYLFLRLKKLFLILFSFNSKIYYSFLHFFVSPSYEHLKLIKKFKDVKIFVDVGANKGQFSLLIHKLFPTTKILAFEPIDTEYKIYLKIFQNSKNIQCFNIALGNKNYKKKIFITKRKDSSSILKPIKLQNSLIGNYYINSMKEIKIKKLKNFLKKFDTPIFLKIDVQGYELEVLKGTNLNFVKYIYVECSYLRLYENQPLIKDITKYLYKRNFKFVNKYNLLKKNNKIIQADVLFENIKISA